jgi:hypothetical protein
MDWVRFLTHWTTHNTPARLPVPAALVYFQRVNTDRNMEQLDLKSREERKRDRHWQPKERWQAIHDMITWAESQAAVKRNTPAQCMEKERRLLAQYKTRPV